MSIFGARIHTYRVVVKSEDAGKAKAISRALGRPSNATRCDVELVEQVRDAYLEVLRAAGGDDAVDVVVWDVGSTPERNDLELFSRLWEADPDLQLLILSPFPDYCSAAMRNRFTHSGQFIVTRGEASARAIRRQVHSLADKGAEQRLARQTIHGHVDSDTVIR